MQATSKTMLRKELEDLASGARKYATEADRPSWEEMRLVLDARKSASVKGHCQNLEIMEDC